MTWGGVNRSATTVAGICRVILRIQKQFKRFQLFLNIFSKRFEKINCFLTFLVVPYDGSAIVRCLPSTANIENKFKK